MSQPQAGETIAGIWREGNRLVILKSARLPHACIKCGRAITGRGLRKTFYWSPSNIFRYTIFPLTLIAVVIDLMRREKTIIEIPICAMHRRKRVIGLLLTWLFCGCGLVAIGFGLNSALSPMGSDADNAPAVIVSGIVSLLIGAACFVFAGRLLKPREIDLDRAVFSGAGAQFLQLLPTSPNLRP
jgi:hypothetical protein